MPYKSDRLWSPTGAPKLGVSLKVLQWNVLADGLAQHGDFVRVRSSSIGTWYGVVPTFCSKAFIRLRIVCRCLNKRCFGLLDSSCCWMRS